MNDRIDRPEQRLLVVALLLVLASLWPVAPAPSQPRGETTVLRAARILDGRGAVLEDRDLVVRDGRIAGIVARGDGRGDRAYDLTALTVLPGYIDTHVHIGNHFDDDGKVHREENDPGVAHVTLHGAENAYRTLMNGVTTMQSLGSPDDAELRAWIDRGEIPGPRLLSSLGAVREDTGTPDEIRAYVRDRAAAGADVIKVFASTSIRFGGVTNLSAAQLEAACGEARAQGLRSVVHLHRSDALRLTAAAGCTQVEHGWLLEPGDVGVFVESGMYLGNQIDLLFRNYEERGDRYAGVGGYTLEGFANLQASRPGALAFFRAAAATPGVRIVYSTDANAGSHGANTDELVAYVEQGGQDPMDAVVSATSLAAESLGLEDRIGAIATGYEADIIALDGDPLTDPAALGRVVFVMRGGHVYKNGPPRAAERSTEQSRLSAAVRERITPRGLEEQAAAIVRHQRPSGSAGERAAIDHIVDTLRRDGVDVQVHTYQAYASTPIAASLDVVGASFSPDAITYSFSAPTDGLEAHLVDGGDVRDIPALQPGTGERLVLAGEIDAPGTARSRYPDVTGAIVLVDGNPGRASLDRLAMLGAAGVVYVHREERLNDLIVTSTWGTPSLRNYHRLPAIPAVHIRRSDGDALRSRLAQRETRVRITAEVDAGWRPHHLAVARIPAPDPDAPFVLFGGHIDSWYFGGTDEGASNAAMVELARAFHANRQRLRRGLVVAWWPGHSNARYGGSTWFADHYFDELRTRGVAYVNIDGMGQMGARRFGATASAALGGLAADVVTQLTGEAVEPARPGRNSDQSFNGVGLPLLQLDHRRLEEDGGYWWWHTPDDTFDKIDFDVLKTDTDLYADALARLLGARRLPVDLTSQVRALGEALDRRAQEAGDRFDLAEAIRRQRRLLELVSEVDAGATLPPGPPLDLTLLRILRPLHRVLYSPSDPFHPDPGLDSSALPGLSPLRTLATSDPEGDAYRFAEVTLLRERNRLLEALDVATGATLRLLGRAP